jgi:uncharacterized protein (TIGR00369 family)
MNTSFDLARVKETNEQAAFNRWVGIEVVSAAYGEAELAVRWKDDLGQYAGYLHAGVIAGLIDTACGFAAATVVGNVLASHFSVNCMAPAVGSSFVVKAEVIRAGKRQVFTRADLFALSDETNAKHVATGETILLPVP